MAGWLLHQCVYAQIREVLIKIYLLSPATAKKTKPRVTIQYMVLWGRNPQAKLDRVNFDRGFPEICVCHTSA
jgi:hypothetical protein